MARVFVKNLPFLKTNVPPPDERFEGIADTDTRSRHRLVGDPTEADLIIFSKLSGHGPYLEVLFHPLFRKYPLKSYLFVSGDNPFYPIPGLFTSLDKRHHRSGWTRSCHYIHGPTNPFFRRERIDEKAKYLCSFVGSAATHPVRERLLERAPHGSFMRNTQGGKAYGEMSRTERTQFRREYADVTYASSFVLCPRGGGSSSFRLFEAMQCGRAPVILADNWVPPRGPDWGTFSLRLPESAIGGLEARLRSMEPHAREMGRMAREAWSKYFCPEASFDYLVQELLALHRVRSRAVAWHELRHLLAPRHLKGMLRTLMWSAGGKNLR